MKFTDPMRYSDLFKNKNKNVLTTGFNAFYLDIYLKDIHNIWNIIDKENTFFNTNLTFSEIFNIITEEEYTTKNKIFSLLSDFSYYTKREVQNIFYDSDIESNVVMNLFQLLYNKGYDYLQELSSLEKIVYFEKIRIFFSFLNIHSLSYFADLSSIVRIDLTNIKINDIKTLCGEVPFIELRTLIINKNTEITNLYELKNAKFINLQELYLIEDGLEDLSQIEMDKYPFENLIQLDLSKNKIQKIEPILHFKNLKNLNLRDNKVFTDDAIILIQNLNCKIDLRCNYAYYDEIRNKCEFVSNLLC